MKPSEYLSHFRLQDLGKPMFQILDKMSTSIPNTNQQVPAVLMLALAALDVLEGSPDSALEKGVKALRDAKAQETEHYKALRDYITQEIQV